VKLISAAAEPRCEPHNCLESASFADRRRILSLSSRAIRRGLTRHGKHGLG
jgi:hypothetical protein